MPSWLQQILTLAIPVIVGVLTVPLVNLIKKASTWVDALPDAVKQLFVLLVAYAANLLSGLLGVTLPTSLGGFDSTAVGTLISAVLAYLLHLASSVSIVKSTQAATVAPVAKIIPVSPTPIVVPPKA